VINTGVVQSDALSKAINDHLQTKPLTRLKTRPFSSSATEKTNFNTKPQTVRILPLTSHGIARLHVSPASHAIDSRSYIKG
jgi:hypothetical protein